MQEWSQARLTIAALALAAVAWGCIKYIAGQAGLDTLADILAVTGAGVIAAAPLVQRLFAMARRRFQAQPGQDALSKVDLQELGKSLRIDQDAVKLAMVPAHQSMAAPAPRVSALNWGNARFTTSVEQRRKLMDFLSRPREKHRAASDGIWRDVMVVTGEPGAGKSVLMQEMHFSLSQGVASGSHSFVPLVVFARDLQLASLLAALEDPDMPMRSFLAAYYMARAKAEVGDQDLRYLQRLIATQWENADFLVIVDGLDEIPQRSAYEDTQRALARLIEADLSKGGACVHRYILSCRIDEDLELFPKSPSLRLTGLNEGQRKELCQALAKQHGVGPELLEAMTDALSSTRLAPSHVFRRNPYFLSLLLGHLREDQDRVRSSVLGFDDLMRRYLERESSRPFASAGNKDHGRVEQRRALFGDLAPVSQPALQSIAFNSVTVAAVGALYDEAPIDDTMLRRFCVDVPPGNDAVQVASLWESVAILVSQLTTLSGSADDVRRRLYGSGVPLFFREADLGLLIEAAPQAKRHLLAPVVGWTVLGSIPYSAALEGEDWYRRFSGHVTALLSTRTIRPEDRLAGLLFLRGLAAAHALRIVYVNLKGGAAFVRFRHRRLAEYFAACYCRDRWEEVKSYLVFTPWLSPVLNLACALEKQSCGILAWLVDQADHEATSPIFRWRHALEAAVEACAFAHPGPTYAEQIARLCRRITYTLAQDSFAQGREAALPGSAVIRIVLLRMLEQLAGLKGVVGTRVRFDPRPIYRLSESATAEWVGLLVPAVAAVETLSEKRCPPSARRAMLARAVGNPGSVLLGHTTLGSARGRWEYLTVLGATAVGFLCMTTFRAVGLLLLFLLLPAMIFGVEQEVWGPALQMASAIVVMALLLWSLQQFRRSPGEFLYMAASPWRRLLPVIKSATLKDPWYTYLWRALRSTLRFVLQLAIWAIVVFMVVGLSSLMVNSGAPTANRDLPAEAQEMVLRYKQRLQRSNDAATVEAIQRSLRNDLEELKQANLEPRKRFAVGEEKVLIEDWVADQLFAFDRRLLPAPKNTATFTGTIERARRLLASQLPEAPPHGPAGSLASIQVHNDLKVVLDDLKRVSAEINQARRNGVLVDGSSQATMVLLGSLDRKMSEYTELQRRLWRRSSQDLAYAAIFLLTVSLLTWLYFYQRRQGNLDRVILALHKNSNLESLCAIVADENSAEPVRNAAMLRIDDRGVRSEDDLELITRHADALLNRSSEGERNMGIRLARLSSALSNRLRHRMSVDAGRAS
jgi:hypothetical protein